MSDLECWIWFAGLFCLRFRTRQALLERFGSARGIWFADRHELEQIPGLLPEERDALLNRDDAAIRRIVHRCGELGVTILTYQDAAYPERLRNIPDPPYVLYILGTLPAVDSEPVIGVVGTRKSTPYGERITRAIAGEIARCGGTVTTGLAAGIDSCAAVAALDAGGSVIGVLGVAINRVYPSFNGPLYDRVRARGALVSEYPPDAEGTKEWFPRRNRIIAALSLGVVVPEAPARSGALITAHRALDYGRDVYAVPANADSAKGAGSNQLLREGAAFVTCGWDVMQEYAGRFPEKITHALPAPEPDPAPEPAPAPEEAKRKGLFRFRLSKRRTEPQPGGTLAAQLETLTENQLKIVSVMDRNSMHVDDIIDLTKLSASTVLSELTMLQIKGYVSQEQGKRFTLNIMK
ncbi:MAG: DNA-protecting protein DprA [Ruminococcaceae bacterium]|nr:DNA-protecting protein DprA [Oscillospiraceae bacterium]